jgi:hypothetical protein
MAVVGAIATLVAAATGAVELWQTVTRDDRPAPSAVIRPAHDYKINVTWAKYRSSHPEAAATTLRPSTNGVVFAVALEVRGMRDETGRLRWSPLEPDGNEVAIPAAAPRSAAVRPTTEPWHVVQDVWVPIPSDLEAFVVEFSFVDHTGVTRAAKRGPKINLLW